MKERDLMMLDAVLAEQRRRKSISAISREMTVSPRSLLIGRSELSQSLQASSNDQAQGLQAVIAAQLTKPHEAHAPPLAARKPDRPIFSEPPSKPPHRAVFSMGTP